jgi:AraC-like DNA-binding protein
MDHRTVSSGVDALVLLQHGRDHAETRAAQARREAGISELVLHDPQGRIPAAQHLHLLHLLHRQGAQRLAVDELRMDWPKLLEAFPAYASVLVNSPSLAVALHELLRLRPLLGEVDALIVHRQQDAWVFEYRMEGPERSSSCAYRHFAMVELLARHYQPQTSTVATMELIGAPFASRQSFSELHDCMVRFGAGHNRLMLMAPGADQPYSQHNPVLHRHHVRMAEAVLARLKPVPSTRKQLAAWLSQVFHDAGADHAGSQSSGIDPGTLLEAACEEFRLSRWSLQRRLREEGTSFSDAMDHARAAAAQRLLSGSPLTLTEIADRLGFSALSAFSRFFSSHSGMTPSRYRALQQHRSTGLP